MLANLAVVPTISFMLLLACLDQCHTVSLYALGNDGRRACRRSFTCMSAVLAIITVFLLRTIVSRVASIIFASGAVCSRVVSCVASVDREVLSVRVLRMRCAGVFFVVIVLAGMCEAQNSLLHHSIC